MIGACDEGASRALEIKALFKVVGILQVQNIGTALQMAI